MSHLTIESSWQEILDELRLIEIKIDELKTRPTTLPTQDESFDVWVTRISK